MRNGVRGQEGGGQMVGVSSLSSMRAEYEGVCDGMLACENSTDHDLLKPRSRRQLFNVAILAKR